MLLSKTMVAGEQIGVSGALPFAVVIGRIDLTDVLVREAALCRTRASKETMWRDLR